MSQTSRASQAPPTSASTAGMQNVQPTNVTGWVGWIAFASTMMVLLGMFHIIEGLVAIFNDDVFLVGKEGLTVHLDYTAWGWAHLIGGVVIILAALGMLRGQVWARVVGVMLAMISALLNIAFLPAYPIWSTILIAVDVLVIWALTVHGGELRD